MGSTVLETELLHSLWFAERDELRPSLHLDRVWHYCRQGTVRRTNLAVMKLAAIRAQPQGIPFLGQSTE